MATEEKRGIVLEIIDTHLYPILPETTDRIRPLAERLNAEINQLIESIRNTENPQRTSSLARSLSLLASNLLTYIKQMTDIFRSIIFRLSIALDSATKQSKTETISKTIIAQRRLQDELDYLITLRENIKKLILLCRDFSEDNPQNISNIQEATRTELTANWLAHVNASINSLLINKKTSILTKVNETRSAVA